MFLIYFDTQMRTHAHTHTWEREREKQREKQKKKKMHKDDKYQIQTTQQWLLEGVITMGSDAQDITWTFCMLKQKILVM